MLVLLRYAWSCWWFLLVLDWVSSMLTRDRVDFDNAKGYSCSAGKIKK